MASSAWQSLYALLRTASANAIAAALAPAVWTPTVLGDSGRGFVGAWYAVVPARHPAHRAPLAGLSQLRQLLGLLRDGEPRQQHSRDDQSFQHDDCPQRRSGFGRADNSRLRAISTAVLTASSRSFV